MKKNITKRAIVFILTLFVFTCISLAEALPPTLQQENINLKESLEDAYYQAESAQQVNVEQKENLIKELYPLFMGSCAEGYIKEQLAQNPNWRINRIKDNGEFEKIERRSIHSYTIISTSGWKTFKCNDTWSFESYINLNKNPKDYQIYLALLKARIKLYYRIQDIVQTDSRNRADFLSLEKIASLTSEELRVNTCEYAFRYYSDFYYDLDLPKDMIDRIYKNSDLVSYYPYAECLGKYELIPRWIYVYRLYDDKDAKPGSSYVDITNPNLKCNNRDVRICFIRYERKLFSGKITPAKKRGFSLEDKVDPKDIKKCIDPKFVSFTSFKLNDYLDPSIGVKCEQIPDVVFQGVKETFERKARILFSNIS